MDSCRSNGNMVGRILGTGKKSASELTECWKNSPQQLRGGGPSSSAARYETQKCITDSRPKASAHLLELRSAKLDPSGIECD